MENKEIVDKQQTHGGSFIRSMLLTVIALIAFASNSVLCRLALGGKQIDPASFTTLRLVSGAVVLGLMTASSRKKAFFGESGSWFSALMLLTYALGFSFAYLGLTTGTGALILFGSVQVTMLSASVRRGDHPHSLEWTGMLLALGGLVYLVSPGLAAPPLTSAALMAAAGLAWGAYTLRGRGVGNPIAATADNFIRSVPIVLLAALPFSSGIMARPSGILLAVTSGAITSGLGYVVWYIALRGLTVTRAALVQLSVPILAALGGVLVLSEEITVRLVISATVTLSGIALSMAGRKRLKNL